MLRTFVNLFVTIFIATAASFATAVVPDTSLSTAVREYAGPETAVMFNIPSFGGNPFTAASIIGGTVDATITLTMLDGNGMPIANIPSEDCWLESADGGLVACRGGTTADFDTNYFGVTTWVSPIQAGGSSEALTVVMVAGSALTSSAGLAISHNSADINGDGAVNLSDVPLFAGDFYGGVYAFRSDFAFDGAVNLSDVVKLAQALGESCLQ